MSGLLVELEPGQRPEDLPRPPSLHGARLQRKVPLAKLETNLRRKIARATKKIEAKVLRELERSGLLRKLEADAERRREAQGKQGPVGRGGIPLGPERELVIERIFRYDDMEAVARLFRDPEAAFAIELEEVFDEAYPEMFNRGGNAARLELGARGSFRLRNPAIADALFERANHLAGNIAEDVFDRMKTVIADGFYLEGRGIADVARALREEFDWMSSSRAERIARTETLSVTEEAQLTVYQASGVHLKRWITTLDGRERESHFLAHGQLVPIDEPFEVGDSLLMYPGDPDAPPGEICNCRCATQPVVSEEQIFSDADIWRGDVDPDEFAKNRGEIPDELTRGPSPPPPSETGDLEFGDEEPGDEKRARRPKNWQEEEAERLIDFVEQESAMFRAATKAEREYERDERGRFGSGSGGASQAEAPGSQLFDMPERARGVVEDYEQRLMGNSFETGAAVDEDGNVLLEKAGGDNEITYTREEFAAIKGKDATFTHNHPAVRSLSLEDADFASAAGLREMRAIDSRGNLYRMQSTRAGVWPGRERIREVYAEKKKEVIVKLAQEMARGLPKETAYEQVGHRTWLAAAPELGIRYEMIEPRGR